MGINDIENLSRTILLIICFGFLTYVFFRNKQDVKLNWAMFFASLWVLITLPIVNYISIKCGFWNYTEVNAIQLPFDLFFIWLVIWGVVVPFFTKGNYLLLVLLIVLWMDVLFMPLLERLGVLELNEYWLIGEVLMISIILLPSMLWAKYSFENRFLWVRAVFQFMVMGLFLLIVIPFIINLYFPFDRTQLIWKPYVFQFIFMVSLPGLIAVKDLVVKGKGTPFPYDKTKYVVRSGVYAYIRNPIQWSFTFVFIPMAIGFQSYWLLVGSFVSLGYTFGVSNIQEFDDMEVRFGDVWSNYKREVTPWFFLWKPINIPVAQIYFKEDCSFCQELKKWFESKSVINLELKHASDHKEKLKMLTLVDEYGVEFKSVEAVAHALGHINLLWASLSWFMRLPLIIDVLQAIIDTMDLENETCAIDH